MEKKLNILFLCTGNACRSQMAEGWTRFLKSDAINAFSAGVTPHGLDQRAVTVMAEVGIDISDHISKPVDDFLTEPLDYVITVCGHANENCPFFPGRTKVIHVGFDDPPKLAEAAAAKGASESEQLDYYREVRDQIKSFVETLPNALTQ